VKNGKSIVGLIALMACIMLIAVCVALAGSVYERTSIALNAFGTGTWTNAQTYAAIKLAKIWVVNAGNTANTCTVMRITSASAMSGDGYAHTQTCASVSITAANDNGQATLTSSYLGQGDKLYSTCVNTSTASGRLVIEYEVQKH